MRKIVASVAIAGMCASHLSLAQSENPYVSADGLIHPPKPGKWDSGISGFGRGDTMSFSDGKVPSSDISELAKFPQLRKVSLTGAHIENIGSLGDLGELESLKISDNKISDISAFAKLKKLKELWLGGNKVEDLRSLADLKKLETLWLDGNKIQDLRPLSGLKNLESLNLSGNPLGDLSPLAALAVGQLLLSGCSLKDVTGLKGFHPKSESSTVVIDLSDNQIVELGPLGQLEGVQELNLGNNRIAGINALKGSKVRSLDLSGNQIADVGVLETLPNLSELDIRNNPIKDFGPLAALARARLMRIEADKGFEEAYQRYFPVKKELVGLPLIGRWRSEPQVSQYFGTFILEMHYMENGQMTVKMMSPEALSHFSRDDEAGIAARGTFEVDGNILITHIAGDATRSRYEVKEDTLRRGENDKQPLHRVK